MRVLTALGVAWNTFKLYPNPANQPAFQQAVHTVSEVVDRGMLTLEVGAGTFISGGEEIRATRGGADKLAVQMFVHEVELVRIVTAPNAEEVCELFRLLSMEDALVRADGGIEKALKEAGITSLSVRQRGLLGSDDFDEEDGDPGGQDDGDGDGEGGDALAFRTRVAAMIDQGAPPDQIAEALVEKAAGDPELIASEFLEAYREIHDDDDQAEQEDQPRTRLEDLSSMFAPYWTPPLPPAPIGTFVETFFVLGVDAQLAILRSFLANRSDGNHRMFLDQFAGSELADFAPYLDEKLYADLTAYVRDVADVDSGTPDDLYGLLNSSRDVKESRVAAADRVAAMLQQVEEEFGTSSEGIVEQLRADLASRAWTDIGYETLRGLFECEERPYRFLRLVRIWAGRIANHIREGRFTEALALVDAVRRDPPYQRHQASVVDEGLGKLVTPDLLNKVVARYAEKEEMDEAVRLLVNLGPAVSVKLVERLAEEENATNRRVLIDLLAEVSRTDNRAIIERLRDSRWFVVRNLATALGKAGLAKGMVPLRGLLSHEDHRVRVEAVRAMMRISQEESTGPLLEALQDAHPRVREAALMLLRNSSAADLDAAITGMLRESQFGESETSALIDLLADRDTEASRSGLEELAAGGFTLSGGRRALRQAARNALRKKAS